eukprot:CAMPEP_0206239478 /NCGR_PEP_ID=MMETSP0047_2-20121206/15403_1 /ASSEMBLY_ACC=CAM_ASM_000192 /TAXON_ID=195065 /ORGANISM="Chroomonas mesostigmatica_cf, Strain CCMP1168" /LENGTH=291 /DNA_ID=CAMNT_0053664149 /DNA_START=1 /DNA_END=876 /DNA_ORIENTATION=+
MGSHFLRRTLPEKAHACKMLRLVLAVACWAAAADAFAPTPLSMRPAGLRSAATTGIRMQENTATKEPAASVPGAHAGTGAAEINNQWVSTATKLWVLRKYSPLVSYADMPGNKGFDILNLANTQDKLSSYREAELKHGRFAMLAALGWPLSELLHTKIALLSGMPSLLADGGLAPSPIAGGMEKHPAFFGAVLGMGIVLEGVLGQPPENKPGFLGFDPLNVYGNTKSDAERKALEEKEVNNGRLAMLAVTGMAVQEYMFKMPVLVNLQKALETVAFEKKTLVLELPMPNIL